MSDVSLSSRVLVIGLGNRYRQDDAVGLLVAERVAGLAIANAEVIQHEGDPLDLLPLWAGCEFVVIIDALNLPAHVGEVFRFDPDSDSPPSRESVVSSHGHSLWDAWELATLLDQRPQGAIVIAIAGRTFGQAEGLTPEVGAAVEGAVRRVRDEVGRFLV